MGKQRGEDEELWARVAESATPLKTRRAAPSPNIARDKPQAPARQKAARPRPKLETKFLEAKSPETKFPEAKPAAKPVPRGGALDRQVARQLDKGKLAVEARLDLHNMKQREAHAALRRFLKAAHTEGRRHVLVITGKGAGRSESRSFYEEEERGVLRQAVPHWLSQPDLAPLVVSFAEAPRRLGGAGALYVRLRRPRD